MKIHVRPKFWSDLQEESAWLASRAGERVADQWASAVWDSVEELKRNPLLGRPRLDLPMSGIRSWRIRHYPNWSLFYAAKEDGLVLYRLRHGAMNLPRLDFAA